MNRIESRGQAAPKTELAVARCLVEPSEDQASWIGGWPQLVVEWHPTLNAEVTPGDLSSGSGRKVWWKCARGPDHEWEASPNSRTRGLTGCPYCAGRRVSVTNSLARLRPDLTLQWHPERNGALTPERVGVGSSRRVWWRCTVAADHEWWVSVHARSSLGGACPFCRGLRVCATNSIVSTHPDIAAEWHPTKNGSPGPGGVVAGCARLVWWQCGRRGEQHEWRTSVLSRCLRGAGCPFCSGRRASPEHCLEAAHPDIAREWHPTNNGPLSPRSVTPSSGRAVWWRCANGHEWRARVDVRTYRRGPCPLCSGRAQGSVTFPRPDAGTARRPLAAVRQLHAEHRRLEQTLTLLRNDPTAARETLLLCLDDLAAHLLADESLLYPMLEQGWNRAVSELRDPHNRMRELVSMVGTPRVDGRRRGEQLHELQAAFREHARAEESSALPWLEGATPPRALEDLGRQMQALRAKLLARRKR